jgi:hypothetical protein
MKKKKLVTQRDNDLRDDPERRKAYRRMKKSGGAVSEKKIKGSEYKEMIKQRAFEIYQDRVMDNLPGDDFQDWLQAEVESIKSAGEGIFPKNENTVFPRLFRKHRKSK